MGSLLTLLLDTSVLVPLFVNDAHSALAAELIGTRPVAVSDFASAEFASALARRVRMQALSEAEARAAFATFDLWAQRPGRPVETLAEDMRAAATMLRRLDLTLRAPDAIHIATALRLGATLATLDRAMAAAATALGCEVVPDR